MRGIVLYKSKYGATKKYAEWISEDTGYDICEVSKVKVADLREYDVIVLGGGIYAMGIAGLSFLKKNPELISQKKVYVFCDGASPYDEEAYKEVKEHNMKDNLKEVPVFYFRGAWDMDSMGLVDRNLCRMLQKAVAKKDPKDYAIWEKALMEAGSQKCDWTDKEYIVPLVSELKRL